VTSKQEDVLDLTGHAHRPEWRAPNRHHFVLVSRLIRAFAGESAFTNVRAQAGMRVEPPTITTSIKLAGGRALAS